MCGAQVCASIWWSRVAYPIVSQDIGTSKSSRPQFSERRSTGNLPNLSRPLRSVRMWSESAWLWTWPAAQHCSWCFEWSGFSFKPRFNHAFAQSGLMLSTLRSFNPDQNRGQVHHMNSLCDTRPEDWYMMVLWTRVEKSDISVSPFRPCFFLSPWSKADYRMSLEDIGGWIQIVQPPLLFQASAKKTIHPFVLQQISVLAFRRPENLFILTLLKHQACTLVCMNVLKLPYDIVFAKESTRYICR